MFYLIKYEKTKEYDIIPEVLIKFKDGNKDNKNVKARHQGKKYDAIVIDKG